MRRKVSLIGPATLSVSLPSKWAKANNVKKGDEVEVVETENSLEICTSKVHKDATTSIDINPTEPFFNRTIHRFYTKGYNEIRINFRDKKDLGNIEKYVQTIVGFEIVEQGENYCILKSIAEESKEEYGVIFKRMINITITMGKSMIESISKQEYERLENISEMDKMVNKLNRFCKRILNIYSRHTEQDRKCSDYRINCLIEEITDSYRDICKIMISSKAKLSKSTLGLMEQITTLIEEFRGLYFNFDEKRLIQFAKKETGLRLNRLAYFDKAKNKSEVVVLSLLFEILDKLHHISEEL